MKLKYKQNTATKSDIFAHLNQCADYHIPPLSSTVNISSYSEKLSQLSTTFEAWDDSRLIGLIAAYTNDTENLLAFISNVSVLPSYSRAGIASNLLINCIDHCKIKKLFEAKLEVNKSNIAALHLYEKHHFLIENETDTKYLMRLSLREIADIKE